MATEQQMVQQWWTHWSLTELAVISNFQTHIKDRYLDHFLWNCPQVNATRSHWWLFKIGSGNGLVPSCNKPLSKLMLRFALIPRIIMKCTMATCTAVQLQIIYYTHSLWCLNFCIMARVEPYNDKQINHINTYWFIQLVLFHDDTAISKEFVRMTYIS